MLRHRLRCYLPPTRAQTRGMTQLLKCSQKSLFNTWQARAVAIDLDSSDIVLYSTPDATTVSSTVPLISLALVDRMKKDDGDVVDAEVIAEEPAPEPAWTPPAGEPEPPAGDEKKAGE